MGRLRSSSEQQIAARTQLAIFVPSLEILLVGVACFYAIIRCGLKPFFLFKIKSLFTLDAFLRQKLKLKT